MGYNLCRAFTAAALVGLLLGGCADAPQEVATTGIIQSTVVPASSTTAAVPTTTTTLPPTTIAPTTAPPLQRVATESADIVVTEQAVVEEIPTEPAPAPEPGSIEEMIHAAFGEAGAKAVEVARCESGLRPDATNGQFWGLFQIGTNIHAARIANMGYSREDMLSAGPNIAVAVAIYNEQGWRPWTCA